MQNQCPNCRRYSQSSCICSNTLSISLPSTQTISLPSYSDYRSSLTQRIHSLTTSRSYLLQITKSYLSQIETLFQTTCNSIQTELKTCARLLEKQTLDSSDINMIKALTTAPLPSHPKVQFEVSPIISETFKQFLRQPVSFTEPKGKIDTLGLSVLSHTSSINSVALTFDGKFILTASNDRTIKIWDVQTRVQCRELIGHESMISSVLVSQNSDWIVSCSIDRKIFIWRFANGEKITELTGQSDLITSITLSLDSRTLVSGSKDSTIAVFDLYSSSEPVLMRGHEGTVLCVSFSWDNLRILSGSADKTVRIWNRTSFCLEFTLSGHTGSVSCVVPLSKQQIASAAFDQSIRIWNTFTIECTKQIQAHSRNIRHLYFCPTSQILVSSSEDCTVKVWNCSDWSNVSCFTGHKKFVNSSVILQNQSVISVSSDRTIRMWKIKDAEEVFKFPGHTEKLLLFTASQSTALSYAADQTLRSWSLATKQQILSVLITDDLADLILTPDDTYFFTKSKTSEHSVWEMNSFTKLKLLSASESLFWLEAYPNLSNFFAY